MSVFQDFELLFMRWLRKREHRLLTYALQFCTELASARGWIFLSVFLILFVDSSFGLRMGLSSFFGAISAQCIKRLIKRKRPCMNVNAPSARTRIPDEWSFPSGHTTSICSVATMLFLMPHPWFGMVASFAILVGISRIYLGVHYPSDVLCGALLGIMCGHTFHWLWQTFYLGM